MLSIVHGILDFDKSESINKTKYNMGKNRPCKRYKNERNVLEEKHISHYKADVFF